MVKFEFWLGDEDTDRLFFIKETQGKNDLSGNEFAQELFTKELHRLHPQKVKYNENEEI